MASQRFKANILFLFAVLLVISAKAADMVSTAHVSPENTSIYSPQVCQFSLTSYSGVVTNGYTDGFQVGLSCPQESDVRATVVVFINGEHAASKVVTIKAGKDYSERVDIKVGSMYNDQRYRLVVQ